jgi:hypothetical protein
MDNNSFDDLILAFQSALVVAQDALRKRREEAVRRMYEVDETGAERSPVLAFSIPRNSTDKVEYEMFSLPASSFRAHHSPQLSMLSLEFACELTETKLSGATRTYTLVIRASKKKKWWQKKRRRMQIVFDGSHPPSGEVRIDGELLMEIPPYGSGAGGSRSMVEAKPSLFRALLNRLRDLWQPQKFIMAGEQAKRAREIMEQKDTGSPADKETKKSGTRRLLGNLRRIGMSINKVGKRIITVFAFLAICTAVSSLETACDAGSGVNSNAPVANNAQNKSDNSWFEHDWSDETNGVTLHFNGSLELGEGNAILTYVGNCSTKGIYKNKEGNKYIFSLLSQNGGTSCDKLSKLSVWNTGGNTLSYTVTSDKGTNTSGELSRSGK